MRNSPGYVWEDERAYWLREAGEGTELYVWGLHTDTYGSTRAGKYLPYPPADGIAIDPVDEPVNQAPTFMMWREHLCTIAHELQHQQFERGAMRSSSVRSHASRPANITDEDAIRNANISQWGREEVGRLWRELHGWAELDPTSTTNDWNGVPRQEMQAKIEGFCAACEGRGRIDLIHDEHNHLVWKEALRRGQAISCPTSIKRNSARLNWAAMAR